MSSTGYYTEQVPMYRPDGSVWCMTITRPWPRVYVCGPPTAPVEIPNNGKGGKGRKPKE